MTGAVDVSPRAALALTAGEEMDLWERARAAGVLVRIVASTERRGGYFAVVDGHGRRAQSYSDDPYHAGIAALARAAAAA
jgi:hypothetical protein